MTALMEPYAYCVGATLSSWTFWVGYTIGQLIYCVVHPISLGSLAVRQPFCVLFTLLIVALVRYAIRREASR